MSTSARMLPERLLQLMEVYQQDATRRVHETNEMRFMYEESPHYEQGFVMAEIIEKYRKMVEHTKRPINFPSDNVFTTMKRTELVQKLYFEIYHLCNMIHEVARKYQYMPEFKHLDEAPIQASQIYMEEEQKKFKDKIEKREKKKKDKFLNKLETFITKDQAKKKTKKVYNKWWPLDYGWEIDYLW